MTELVLVLIAGMWLFMLLVVAVFAAFDFIANAFEPAFSRYEQESASGRDDDRAQ